METIKKTDWVQLKDYRIFLVINTIGIVGISVHLVLIPVFYWLNLKFLSILNIFSSAMWISSWVINKRGRHQTAVLLMTIEVIAHTLCVVPVMGWHSGFQYYLFAAIPFTLFNNILKEYLIIVVSIGMCILFIMLNIYTHDTGTAANLTESIIKIINLINIVISFTAMGLICYYFRVASLSLEHELEKQAHTDPLTGLFNRRRMLDFLDKQGSLSARNCSNLSLIFVDIDHFKQFNDTYGHDCGDYILGEVAKFMKQHLRCEDAVARWGGEEFLITLPGTDIQGARIIAEKIRKAIAEQTFRFCDKTFSITMTFGISQVSNGRSIDDCLKEADLALYKGKEAGRNLVMG